MPRKPTKPAKKQELGLRGKDVTARHLQAIAIEKAITPVLLDYQTKWVLDEERLKVAEKGRQEGFTWIEALWSVRRRLKTDLNHYFSSADWLTSKEFIGYCKYWAEFCNLAVSDLQHEFIRIEDSTAESLTFPTGAKIIAVSSNPKAMRGKKGDVTLDEFAFHESADDMLTAAQACTTWGGDLHLISTHNGPATPFYQVCRDAEAKRNDYSWHRVTLVDAVRDGLALKVPGKHLDWLPNVERVNESFIRSQRSKCLSQEAFDQEYMCSPLSASTLILPHEYDAVLELTKGWDVPDQFPHRAEYNELFVGVDVGRAKAITVIWVLERGYDDSAPHVLRNVYRTVCVIPIANQDIGSQYQVLKNILSHRAASRCVIDMGAIGRALSDLAVADFGQMVQPLAVTNPKKAEVCERLKHFIQSKRVSLPRDPLLREDILSLRRLVSKQKTLTYDGQSTLGHCDAAFALGFALHAAEQDTSLSWAMIEHEQQQQKALTAA